MYNNSFLIQTRRPYHPKPQKQRHTTPTHKWATFTYIGKETMYITNLFRHTNINVAFRTNNTIYNRLSPTHHTTDKYTQSGDYKLTCPDCNKAYVGQTGRSLLARYKDHKRVFRHNSHTSKFAQHLNEHAHSFGTIHNTMQILQYHKKSTHLNTIEHYYIHAEFTANVCFAPQIRTRHPEHRSTLHSTTISLIKKPN